MKRAKIVFFGNERIATGVQTDIPTVRWLHEHYDLAAIVASHSFSQSRQKRPLEVADFAAQHGIPFYQPLKLIELEQYLCDLQSDIAVLVAYGQMIPQKIIDLFPHGIINIHPSLLPKHRGPTPLESAILSGEKTTGVSIMKLVKAMDAGPIFAQSEVALSGSESKQGLADMLLAEGLRLLAGSLPDILRGKAQSTIQDETLASYDKQFTKQSGIIDWTKPASLLAKEVRAYAGWPKSTTKLGDINVVITKAHVSKTSDLHPGKLAQTQKGLLVGCGDGALEITYLIPAGKKEMSAVSFINGYRSQLVLGD